MSTDDEVPPAEQTFADVLNGLTLAGRRARDRHPRSEPQPARPTRRHAAQPDDGPLEENAASVRAYAWTGGRTRSDFQLEIETLVSTSPRALELIDTLRTEHQSVARLCHHSKSVAEVSALLSLPLGVVRVLLGDMASLGLIEVHRNRKLDGDRPDMELLERVLRGLTNLRAAPAHPS
ncbi:MAG TPA: DUF742 domain-containing protein [Actinophytocola sp.]|uniref:DUF742 domain-containing protein n=1 Tax=Actinophytocola sp. TaxID=1872138 RepID=UPI002DDD0BE4|nr:DUF742 domain-containing protein [Actinophytocola sp.]HEV2783565.1 DUF742 domain-containing protein [Actinophytocola sp.]